MRFLRRMAFWNLRVEDRCFELGVPPVTREAIDSVGVLLNN